MSVKWVIWIFDWILTQFLFATCRLRTQQSPRRSPVDSSRRSASSMGLATLSIQRRLHRIPAAFASNIITLSLSPIRFYTRFLITYCSFLLSGFYLTSNLLGGLRLLTTYCIIIELKRTIWTQTQMYIINSRLGFDHILGFWVLFFSLNYTLMYCKHYAAYCILTSFYILQYTHIHIVLFSYAIYCDAFVRFSLLELLYSQCKCSMGSSTCIEWSSFIYDHDGCDIIARVKQS